MKVVLILGSRRKDGFSAAMAKAYIASLPADLQLSVYNAYDLSAHPCTGCGACVKAGKCVYDDLDVLYSDIAECGELIIASPVYFLSFPAPLKAVIDRMQVFHESILRGESDMHKKDRKLTVLLSAGAPSERGEVVLRQMKWIARTIGADRTQLACLADTDRILPDDKNVRAADAIMNMRTAE